MTDTMTTGIGDMVEYSASDSTQSALVVEYFPGTGRVLNLGISTNTQCWRRVVVPATKMSWSLANRVKFQPKCCCS